MPALRLTLLTLASLVLLAGPAHAIVGGKTADRPWPMMAGMEYRQGPNDSSWSFRCGGSLVAADVVLTAAHCVSGDTSKGEPDTFPAENFRFIVGTNNKSDGSGARIQAVEVREHPEYDTHDEGGFDVALVKLARSATEGSPIALAGTAERSLWEPGDEATVIGWGTEFFGSPTTPSRLKEATVPVKSDAECQATSVFSIDPPTMVCAGNLEGGEDSCQGDSGGPLMVSADGVWKQIGVVSFGLGCAFPTQYGVYGEVGAGPMREWVEANRTSMTSAGSGGSEGTDTGGTKDTGGPADGTAGSSSESSSSTAQPPAMPAAAVPPPTITTAPVKAKLRLPAALGSLRKARRRGAFRIRLRFNVPVTIRATLRQRGRTVARGSRKALRRGTLRLRIARKAKIRRGKARLRVAVTDANGRRYTARRTVRLRR